MHQIKKQTLLIILETGGNRVNSATKIMKTYQKSQFITEFKNKTAIAFLKPEREGWTCNVTDVEDIWGLIGMFPGDAEFNVYSFSARLADKKLLKDTFTNEGFDYYNSKYISDFQKLEDNGNEIFVVYIPDFYNLRSAIIARQNPYEVTAEMIRRALGKNVCKMLDVRGKEVKGLYRYIEAPYYRGRADFATREEARVAVESEVKELQSYVRGVLHRCKDIDVKGLSLEEGVKVWLKYQKQQEKEQKKEQKARKVAELKARKKYEAEQNLVCSRLDYEYGVESFLERYLRTGEHTDTICGHIANENGIIYNEVRDWDGYSRRCKFAMVRRSFVLNVKRGYRVRVVGGLITFYKGEFKREGMKVEWIEQGRSINDITKHVGYLVRGEHIEAKSLREAIRINEEHRAMKLARLLSKRKSAERREEEKKNGNLKITFADSLNAGNCRPGTQEFKNKYEEAIGHKATSISIADLRKYAKMFGVEYYAEQAIDYALNH